MKILVTGGAGYIGSFMVKRLLEEGNEVVVLDSLERGKEEAVDDRANLLIGNLLDKHFISQIFSQNKFDSVLHFAGYISMGESMRNPSIYFENNIFGALNILEQMVRNKCNNFIFSSTAGVYGNPVKTPIPEDHPKNPTNPYGESKLMVEKIIQWYKEVYGLNFVSLRYFNACGAALDGKLGEDHNPETHIIPLAIRAALTKSEFKLFGNDYETADGTCIRDYIHILDLIEAHVLSLEKLRKENGGFFYNVGTGKGFSNRDVLGMVKKISGIELKIKILSRRAGDAGVLIADPTRIKNELGFTPRYSDLKTIVKTAWEWHNQNSK